MGLQTAPLLYILAQKHESTTSKSEEGHHAVESSILKSSVVGGLAHGKAGAEPVLKCRIRYVLQSTEAAKACKG
jgi:hypothetical protein